MLDLSSIPIIDHHAHPLLRPEASSTAVSFQQWFTESTAAEIHARHVPQALFFRTGLRWLAELLDCEPAVEAVLTARANQPYEAWVRRLFTEANIEWLLCDYGYQGEQAYDHPEMQTLLPCPVRPILRLETLAQELILQHETFAQMFDAFTAVVGQAAANGYVALKSIIAYRSGLAVMPSSYAAAGEAFIALRDEAERHGRVRLASKPLCDFLVWQAVGLAAAQEMPVQFHTGFGDSHADLQTANPLWLKPLIEHTKTPLVLLHAGWPFFRDTAHMAALYPHVWLDLSLAIPFATTGIPNMLRDILGMAPFSKIMFATDAFTMPEIYWLAARWGRWGLAQVLEEMIRDGFLTMSEAWDTAVAILGENARKLYLA
jgi:hypothetical protein